MTNVATFKSILHFLVPLQILVLTHEMADLSSSDALEQLAKDFYPVLPVVMYGRPAKLGTEAPSETCVWYGWRDLRA